MTARLVNCCTAGLILLAAVYEAFLQVEGEGLQRKGGVPGELRISVHDLLCCGSVCCGVSVNLHWFCVDGTSILLNWAEERKVCCLRDKRCVVGMSTRTLLLMPDG